jgi:hypothetical protein
VDRSEWNVGLDVGCQLGATTRAFVGYRYGEEDEGTMVGSPYQYNTQYHRPLVGIEGQPAKWVKLGVSLGPDIHHTTSNYAPGFTPDYTTLWTDAVITFLPSARDTIALTVRRNTQPAFASPSVYDDSVYDLLARHAFDTHWSASTGFRAQNGDWLDPVNRNDWIFTMSVAVGYSFNRHWNADLAYAYEWADSLVPGTAGREYTRNLASLGIKYSF